MFVKNNMNQGFVPKNIEKRAKDLELIKAQELKEYDAFIKDFEHNLKAIKNISDDPDLFKIEQINPQEQLHLEMSLLFIDLIKDCQIKIVHEEYPFCIILLQDDNYMFEYDWKNDVFWCHYDKVWSVFKSKFGIDYKTWQDFILNWVEKHFKFRPSTTL